jgi:hypothetical protein
LRLSVRDRIKRECWDKMRVKGRGICAFNSNLLVENYPLAERTKEELAKVEHVEMLRRIELAAQKTRNELTHDMMKKDNITEIVLLTDLLLFDNWSSFLFFFFFFFSFFLC